MSNHLEPKAIDILIDEYRRGSASIQSLFSQNEKVTSVWLALIGFVFGIGLKENIAPIFLLMPPAVIALLFYLIYIYEHIMILGGYLASLEIRINDELKAKVLRWETEVSPQWLHFRLSVILMLSIVLSMSLAVISYSIFHTFWLLSPNNNLASDHICLLYAINCFLVD
jgi:hypothetical protein